MAAISALVCLGKKYSKLGMKFPSNFVCFSFKQTQKKKFYFYHQLKGRVELSRLIREYANGKKTSRDWFLKKKSIL
jgi:hypothetical protein